MKSVNRIPIRGYNIDHFGHVNHGRYVELLEEARWCYLEENSLLETIHKLGAFHVVSKLEINYIFPAQVMDLPRFETQLTGRFSHGFRIDQDVFLDISDTPILTARVLNVFVNRRGKVHTIDEAILDAWPDLASAEKIEICKLLSNQTGKGQSGNQF